MRGSIDIGSNSVLLLIQSDTGENVVNESIVTGLGRDLDLNKEFIPEALKDTLSAFELFFSQCKKHSLDPKSVIVTATEASRVARNAESFFAEIYQKFGFKVTVITGEAEAYYSTMGVLADSRIKDDVITIMDIGGASTELIKVKVPEKRIITSFSMPIGVIRINNWLAENSFEKNVSKVFTDFQKELNHVKASKVYCVAGTMTSVGNMYLGNRKFVEEKVHGLVISCQKIVEILAQNQNLTPDEILQRFPFLGKRSKSIQSGLILSTKILEVLAATEVYISTYGLRYGTLLAGSIDDRFIFKT